MKHEAPPREAIHVEGQWYVLATSPGTGDSPRVLKHGETFALFDHFGDVPRVGSGEHGLYHQGTRHLARHELRLNGQRAMLLNSSVRRDNVVLAVDATNPDVFDAGELATLKGTVHLARSWLLWEGAAHERVELANYGDQAVQLRVALDFAADFADIFEVRGFERERRGQLREPVVEPACVRLGYGGLDGVERNTHLAFDPAPEVLDAEHAEYAVTLAPGARFAFELRVS
jgi:glycogen debranching enzyme